MILIIDDDIAVRTSLLLLLKDEGYDAADCTGPAEAIKAIKKNEPELIILDLNFSNDTSGKEGMELLGRIKQINAQIPVILITGWASIELAVQGMKSLAPMILSINHGITIICYKSIKTLARPARQKSSTPYPQKQLDKTYNFQHIIGEDAKMLDILETIGRVASTDASILIMGESGTGKELIAEAIHQNSFLRKNKPFVKVNLGRHFHLVV